MAIELKFEGPVLDDGKSLESEIKKGWELPEVPKGDKKALIEAVNERTEERRQEEVAGK